MFEEIAQQNENMRNNPNRDKMLLEKFDDPAFTALYDDVWELLKIFLRLAEDRAKRTKHLQKQ